MLKTASKLTIIGDAILPQNAAKLTKKHGCELGVLLWRHLTPQRKTVILMYNNTPSGVQLPQSYLGKFTSCMTFGAHKLVRSEPFFGLPAPKFDTCCWRYICSDMRKKIV